MCDTPITDSNALATAYLKSIPAFEKSWPAVMCKIWIKVTGTGMNLDAWVDVGPDQIVVYPGGKTVCTIVDRSVTFTPDGQDSITPHNATSILTMSLVIAMLVIMLVQMFL